VTRALEVVGRVRKLAVDQARRELAARLAAEAAGDAAEQAARTSLLREREAARRLHAKDASSAAFPAWLPRGLQSIAAAHDASVQAQEAATRARTRLTEAYAAAVAAEQMLARDNAARILEANRREQAALDEVGQRQWRAG
jgi:hypothetical protein